MAKEIIKKIQKRVVNLLKTLSNDLSVAAKDQCSEVARLVGCWILNGNPEYKIQICKGELSGGMSHDILIVENDKLLSLLDPTIWQIFPTSKNVLIGSVDNMSEVIGLLRKKYGGTWKISEIIRECDETYQQKLLLIIKKNSQEI